MKTTTSRTGLRAALIVTLLWGGIAMAPAAYAEEAPATPNPLSNLFKKVKGFVKEAAHSLRMDAKRPTPTGLLSPDDAAKVRDAVSSSGSLFEAQAKLRQQNPALANYLRLDSLETSKQTLDNMYRDGVIDFDQIKAKSRELEPALRGEKMKKVFGFQDNGSRNVLSPTRSGTNPVDAAGKGKGINSDEDVQTKSLEQYQELLRKARDKSNKLTVTDVGPNHFKIEELNTIVWKPTADTYQKGVNYALEQGLPLKVFDKNGREVAGLSADEIIKRGLRVEITYTETDAQGKPHIKTSTLEKPPEPKSFGGKLALGYIRAGDPEYASGANPDLAGQPRTASDKLTAVGENITKGREGFFSDLDRLPNYLAQEKLRDAAKDVVRSMEHAGLDKQPGFQEQYNKLNAFRNLQLPPEQLGSIGEIQQLLRGAMKDTYRVALSNFQSEFNGLLDQVHRADHSQRAALLEKIGIMQENLTYLLPRFDELAGRYKGQFSEMVGGTTHEQGIKNISTMLRMLDEGAKGLKGGKPGATQVAETPQPGKGGKEKPKPGAPEEEKPVAGVGKNEKNKKPGEKEGGATVAGTPDKPKTPWVSEEFIKETTLSKRLNVVLNVGQFMECMQRYPARLTQSEGAKYCLRDQAFGYIQGLAMSAPVESIAFYLTQTGRTVAAANVSLLGTVVFTGLAAKASGEQLAEAYVEGGLWWESLQRESTAEEIRDASRHRRVMMFARLLGKEEKLVADGLHVKGVPEIYGVRDIAKERRQLQEDIARIIREAPPLFDKVPPPGEYDAKVQDYMRRLIEAGVTCAPSASEPDLDKALRLVRSCKNASELKEADEAFRRALQSKTLLQSNATAKLLDEVALFGNSIKAFTEPAEELEQLRAGIPERMKALDKAIKDLNGHHQKFLAEFPSDLLEMVRLNSKRLDLMGDAIRKVSTRGPGEHAADSRNLVAIQKFNLERLIAYKRSTVHYTCLAGCNFRQLDRLLPEAARCKGAITRDSGNFNPYGSLRNACANKLKTTLKPAEPENSEDQVFKYPVYLFRLLDDDGKKAHFMFYAKAEGGKGYFSFPDGSGGMYHRRGDNLGQYRDARSVCAVLRGYGVYFVEYNLGWAPHVSCAKEGPVVKPKVQGGDSSPPAPAATGGGMQASGSSGNVMVRLPSGAVQPLSGRGSIPYGAIVETGSGSQASFTSPGGTTVTVAAGSRVRIIAPAANSNRQTVELLSGSVDVNRPEGRSGFDDVVIQTRDGKTIAIGTRYRVTLSERGTAYQVFEGSIRIVGKMLARTNADYETPGKTAFQTRINLQAGERGFAYNTQLSPTSEQANAATSPLARPDPWNDPQVQQLIDEWMDHAIPVMPADRPGPWSFSRWGQVKGPGITIAGVPDHPAGWTRHQSLWAVRGKYDSLNMCTLGEFVERRIAGRGAEGCAKVPPRGSPPTVIKKGEARADKLPGALSKIGAIPSNLWIPAPPDLSGTRPIMVLAFVRYDPLLLVCSKAAQSKGMAVVGFTPHNDLDAINRGAPLPFTIAVSAKARDTLYALEAATGRQPMLNPIPFGYAYVIDASGRIVNSGPCERLLHVEGYVNPKK